MPDGTQVGPGSASEARRACVRPWGVGLRVPATRLRCVGCLDVSSAGMDTACGGMPGCGCRRSPTRRTGGARSVRCVSRDPVSLTAQAKPCVCALSPTPAPLLRRAFSTASFRACQGNSRKSDTARVSTLWKCEAGQAL